jgi:hypothetical protein
MVIKKARSFSMKRVIARLILAFNVFIWIVVSSINYIGIILQLNNDMIRIFLWSIFIVMTYGLIIYAITLEINRILLILQYRDYKIKYISNKAFMKQNILLGTAILYLYGVCYTNYQFIGMLPMFLFFGNEITNMGRFYVYKNECLYLFEDITKEYQVKEFHLEEKKLAIREMESKSEHITEITYNMDEEEIKFLSGFFNKGFDKVEVA